MLHLGIIPGEANRSLSNTGLGMVPSEIDLARIYGYRPVDTGWINGQTLGATDLELERLEERFTRFQKWQLAFGVIGALSTLTVAYMAFRRR